MCCYTRQFFPATCNATLTRECETSCRLITCYTLATFLATLQKVEVPKFFYNSPCHFSLWNNLRRDNSCRQCCVAGKHCLAYNSTLMSFNSGVMGVCIGMANKSWITDELNCFQYWRYIKFVIQAYILKRRGDCGYRESYLSKKKFEKQRLTFVVTLLCWLLSCMNTLSIWGMIWGK